MAVPRSTQALIATFSFGILLNAAFAALILLIKVYGSTIYRGRLRLSLVLFLFTSSLWALVEFLATLVDPRATSTCRVAVAFSSLFDQFGRVLVELFLAWSVPKGNAKAIWSVIPQILICGRLLIGIPFAATTQARFNPTCVSEPNIRGLAIAIIVLDAVIISLVSVYAFPSYIAKKAVKSDSTIPRARTARWVLVGVVVWWVTSVPSLLGLGSMDLFYRTALPAIGLTVLVVMTFYRILVIPREILRSPGLPVSWRDRNLSSSSPMEHSSSDYKDLEEVNSVSISTLASRTGTTPTFWRSYDDISPAVSRPTAAGLGISVNQNRARSSTVMHSFSVSPIISVDSPLSERLPIDNNAGDRMVPVKKPEAETEKPTFLNQLLNCDGSIHNFFKKIPLINLAEAARNERRRQDKNLHHNSALFAQCHSPRSPAPLTSDMVITKPQMVGGLERPRLSLKYKSSSDLSVDENVFSIVTPTSLSLETLQLRSPQYPEPVTLKTPLKAIRSGELQLPTPRPKEWEQDSSRIVSESVKLPLQHFPTAALPSIPHAQVLKSLKTENSNRISQTAMLANKIVYNNLCALRDSVQEITKTRQSSDQFPSVLHRPRPVPRKASNHHHLAADDLSDSEPENDISITPDVSRYGAEDTMTGQSSLHSVITKTSSQITHLTGMEMDLGSLPSSEKNPIVAFDESYRGQRNSQLLLGSSEDGQSTSSMSDIALYPERNFHYRLGEECPTFSVRKDKRRPRKVPPPVPLLLNIKNTIEASQAQSSLTRDFIESPSRRLSLIANLEEEMEQLKSKWQARRDRFSWDSILSLLTPSSQNSRPNSAVLNLPRPTP
ncbi:hypothetical protein GGS21DRAFT_136106 [Xylaria nigripes]|nr:hypothetical protein GGS21DRAFT_136106 [Xylaria nigripes]